MAQFVKLENGNFLNVSCIKLIRPYAGIKYNSAERLTVDVAIIVDGSEFGGDLIAATGVAPWPNPDDEVEAYNLLCSERDRLEKSICEFFPEIARGILIDLTTYYPPDYIREQLQDAATGTAKFIINRISNTKNEDEEDE